jgi:circadian clock protein KaiB
MPNTSDRVRNKKEPAEPVEWQFKLYVAGESARSLAAFANLKRVCETHLEGKYEIEVIDLQTHPGLAKGDQILAIPSLVRRFPTPAKKIIGDLANEQRLLVGLEIIVSDSYTT